MTGDLITNSAWLLQIYRMTDATTLASAADLLHGIGGFGVDALTSEDGSFLAVECGEPAAAVKVYEIIVLMDPDAELIESTTGPHQPLTPPGLAPESSSHLYREALETLRAETAAKNAAVVQDLEAIVERLHALIGAADERGRKEFAAAYRQMLTRVERDLDEAKAAVADTVN
jgi:hypothetical protein